VVADRSAARAAALWGERLGAARGGRLGLWTEPGKVVVASIADLRSVPAFARPVARWAIASFVAAEDRARAGPPLLLDWEGTVAAAVGAKPGVPSLRLLASDGHVEAAIDGEVSDDRLAQIGAAIDRALAPATGPHAAVRADREGPREGGEP
jgi:hypothetical protein